MGRKSKYSEDTEKKLVMFIRDGLTILDACYGAGISVATFNRWRNSNIEFDRAIHEATSRQWESSFALVKYGARKYRRQFQKVDNYQPKPQNALVEPLRSLQGVSEVVEQQPKPTTWHGLPLADMYEPVKEQNRYYYDQKRNKVFRKVGEVLQNMSGDTWERKHLHLYDEPFLGVVI